MTARTLIAAGFMGLVALMAAVDLAARRRGSTLRTLGDTLSAALRTRPGRIAVLGLWLWLGWHFLAR
jgi:hypothetical protein